MTGIKSIRNSSILFISSYVFFSVMTVFFLNVSVKMMAEYLFTIIICIVVLGRGTRRALKIETNDFVYNFFLSFCIGYSLDIALYFVAALFKQLDYAMPITGIMALGITLLGIKRYESLRCAEIPEQIMAHKGIFCLMLLYLMLNVALYSCGLRPVSANGYTNVFEHNADLYYWASNSVGLKLQWPPEYSFADGLRLNYHYFSSIHVAWMSLVSGIDIFSCSSFLYAYGKSILYFGAFYIFIKEVLGKNSSNRLTIIFLLMVLFSNVFSFYNVVTYHGILRSPIGLDVGYAYSALFLVMFYKWRDTGRWELLFLSLLFWSTAVGAKMPVVVVLLFIPASYMIYDIINKQLGQTLCESLFLMSFAAIGFFCVGAFNVLGLAERNEPGWFVALYSLKGYSNIIVKGNSAAYSLINVLYLLVCYPAIFIISNIVSIKRIKSIREDYSFRLMLSIVLIIVGIIFYVIFDAGNGALNSRYFLYSTYLLSLWILLTGIDQIPELLKKKYFYIYISLLCFQVYGYFVKTGLSVKFLGTYIPVLTFLSYACIRKMGMYGSNLVWKIMMTVSLWCGISYAFLIPDNGRTDTTLSVAYTNVKNCLYGQAKIQSHELNHSDIEALTWIRNNTDKNAVILDDISLFPALYRSFYYCVYAERQQYLDSTYMIDKGNYSKKYKDYINRRREVIRSIYDKNDVKNMENVKKDGVDYIIKVKARDDKFNPPDAICEKVFENDRMCIYRFL